MKRKIKLRRIKKRENRKSGQTHGKEGNQGGVNTSIFTRESNSSGNQRLLGRSKAKRAMKNLKNLSGGVNQRGNRSRRTVLNGSQDLKKKIV